MLTAVAKDEAIAQADAGNYQQAATILKVQSDSLGRVYAAAPASVQVQIQAETNNLDDFSDRIGGFGGGGGGSFDSDTRKTLQEQSFNGRNSK
jgi:hypothetical protein